MKIISSHPRPCSLNKFEVRDVFFPDDVMFNIFARLPVESLVRFKSVCKLWHKLISNKYFIQFYNDESWKKHIVLIKRWFGKNRFSSEFNLGFLDDNVMIRASSNGLLCCTSTTNPKAIYVCNPMTREFNYNVVFANFDPPYSSLLPMECLVFNSETSAWKIFGFDSSISQEHIANGQNRTVSVGRSLYWLTMSSKILVLDLYNEVWKKISLPYQIANKDPLQYLPIRVGRVIVSDWNLQKVDDSLRDEWVLTNKVRLASIGKELREPTFPITLNREFIFLRFFGDKQGVEKGT
ncbi:F-box protein [Cinnamomum micranthum f. kanehirae]|uniref:F-box protein n=1 Tax=Cinnamomum micranthum f. kanehirae TaxID=337451 RepID=A0A3S3R6M2_9MAGN|nr:F-box protein [Cinnamomum micranthum f. kanehirae]